MKSFVEYLTEEQLQEKLIVFNSGAQYGQIVFLAGGGGSGKGFAIDNMLDARSFKIRDVDEMKKSLMHLEDILRTVRKLPDCKPGEKPSVDSVHAMHCNPFSEIRGLDLRTPADVFTLHQFVDKLRLKDITLQNMLTAALMGDVHGREERLPNILFDITAKNVRSVDSAIEQLLMVGYNPHNIHLVWVLQNYRVAVARNAQRSRRVPEDVLLDTHEGAATTMHEILQGRIPHGLDGGVYVILNRDLRKEDGPDGKSDYYGDGKTVKNFDYLKVKSPGEPLDITGERETLRTWIISHIPRSERTSNIIQNPLPYTPSRQGLAWV